MFDLLRFSLKSQNFEMCLSQFICILFNYHVSRGIPEKWDLGPGTSTGGILGTGTRDPKMSRWDLGPRMPKVEPGTQDHKIFKWDRGAGTPKVESGTRDSQSETRDFQFSIVLIVYSILNPLHFTCYKTLD